ncbi:MAG: patatin-like phospholipase family protein [Alphaproteobacteria bacterium]|nr:patatin-like phospholipase family protein [Alphaproteobacteria bacterium]
MKLQNLLACFTLIIFSFLLSALPPSFNIPALGMDSVDKEEDAEVILKQVYSKICPPPSEEEEPQYAETIENRLKEHIDEVIQQENKMLEEKNLENKNYFIRRFREATTTPLKGLEVPQSGSLDGEEIEELDRSPPKRGIAEPTINIIEDLPDIEPLPDFALLSYEDLSHEDIIVLPAPSQKEKDRPVAQPIEQQDLWSRLGIEKKYATILSIDGGGFRGYMPALWVNHIEHKSLAGRKISEIFDFIGGTSIGGIVALGLTSPSIEDSSQVVDLFEKEGANIFPQRAAYNIPAKLFDKIWNVNHAKYNPLPLENLLRGYFGDYKLKDAKTNIVLTSANSNYHTPFLFTSYNENVMGLEMWKAGRATSAAPTYFPGFRIDSHNYVDGGLYHNNPAMLLSTEAIMLARQKDKLLTYDNMVMLSLGTGEMPIQHILPTNSGLVSFSKKQTVATPLIEMMMNFHSVGVHTNMESLLGNNYKRINPLLRYMELDQASLQNKFDLKEAAEAQYEILDTLFTDGVFRHILEADERLFDRKNQNYFDL